MQIERLVAALDRTRTQAVDKEEQVRACARGGEGDLSILESVLNAVRSRDAGLGSIGSIL